MTQNLGSLIKLIQKVSQETAGIYIKFQNKGLRTFTMYIITYYI